MQNGFFRLLPFITFITFIGVVLLTAGCDAKLPPVFNNRTIAQQCYAAINTAQTNLKGLKTKSPDPTSPYWSRAEWNLKKAIDMGSYHRFGNCIAYANIAYDYSNRTAAYLKWYK